MNTLLQDFMDGPLAESKALPLLYIWGCFFGLLLNMCFEYEKPKKMFSQDWFNCLINFFG